MCDVSPSKRTRCTTWKSVGFFCYGHWTMSLAFLWIHSRLSSLKGNIWGIKACISSPLMPSMLRGCFLYRLCWQHWPRCPFVSLCECVSSFLGCVVVCGVCSAYILVSAAIHNGVWQAAEAGAILPDCASLDWYERENMLSNRAASAEQTWLKQSGQAAMTPSTDSRHSYGYGFGLFWPVDAQQCPRGGRLLRGNDILWKILDVCHSQHHTSRSCHGQGKRTLDKKKVDTFRDWHPNTSSLSLLGCIWREKFSIHSQCGPILQSCLRHHSHINAFHSKWSIFGQGSRMLH